MKQNHYKLTSNTFRIFLYDFEQVLIEVYNDKLSKLEFQKNCLQFSAIIFMQNCGKIISNQIGKTN